MTLIPSYTNCPSPMPVASNPSVYITRLTESLEKKDLTVTPYLFAIAIIAAVRGCSRSVRPRFPNGLLKPIETVIQSQEESPFKKVATERFNQWVYRGLGQNHQNVIQEVMDLSSQTYYDSKYRPQLEQELKNQELGIVSFKAIKTNWPSFEDVYIELTKPLAIRMSDYLKEKENVSYDMNTLHIVNPAPLTGKKRKRSASPTATPKEGAKRGRPKKPSASREEPSSAKPESQKDASLPQSDLLELSMPPLMSEEIFFSLPFDSSFDNEVSLTEPPNKMQRTEDWETIPLDERGFLHEIETFDWK